MPFSDSLPAIVVVANNRPASLTRLLTSLAQANYRDCAEVPLVISIDKSESLKVAEIARSFDWKFGSKRVIEQDQKLGLKKHVLASGDLVSEYHSIVLLEDDLMVAPAFYQYGIQALAFYRDDPAIAGVSLYSFVYNEFAFVPFGAVDDGNDVYFIQSAVSWGQIWTSQQWSAFRKWFAENEHQEQFANVPGAVKNWPKTSWKKFYNAYMAAAAKYFAVPRFAMSTNMGDAGTHFPSLVTHYTAPLALGRDRFRLTPLAESKSRYDAFFEMEADCLRKLAPSIADFDFCVDLNGTKDRSQMNAEYVLTARSTRDPKQTFGLRHLPPELNVILQEPGDYFSLARREHVLDLAERKRRTMRYFFARPFNRWVM